MSMSDPVGDMLTRIRNALAVSKNKVDCRGSKFNAAILKVLRDEGYVRGFEFDADARNISVKLKYYGGSPVIESIQRISRPGLRKYLGGDDIKPVMNGLGIAIVSTSKGVMTDHKARRENVGGELICQVT